MRVMIKICGLTRREDVAAALAAGADALGFILYERSPRYVPLERLKSLTADVPPAVQRIGVAVNASPAALEAAVREGGLDVIQFHGDETEAVLTAWHLSETWKAIGLRTVEDVRIAVRIPARVIVVDAVDTPARGGTGTLCDWSLAADLASRRRIVLAGGLRQENVEEALTTVRPWGIDVSSGVEVVPGVKDHERIRQFVATARRTADHLPPPDHDRVRARTA